MDKLKLAKLIISYTVGSSSAYCVSTMIANNVEPEDTLEKVKLLVGSAAIGSMVAAGVKEHVNKIVDDGVEAYQEFASRNDATTE